MIGLRFIILSLVFILFAGRAQAIDVSELTETNIEQALDQHQKDQSIKAEPSEQKANSDVAINNKEQDKSVTEQVVASKPVKEEDIPVELTTKASAGEASGPWTKLFLSLLIVAGLSFATWAGLKRYRFKNRGQNPATQMKILAQHHLGPKRSLAIVRVAGESMLIGITDHHISLIKSLALLDEDIPEDSPTAFNNLVPKDNFQMQTKDEDEFSFAGIRDVVSTKLKNMRSFQ